MVKHDSLEELHIQLMHAVGIHRVGLVWGAEEFKLALVKAPEDGVPIAGGVDNARATCSTQMITCLYTQTVKQTSASYLGLQLGFHLPMQTRPPEQKRLMPSQEP